MIKIYFSVLALVVAVVVFTLALGGYGPLIISLIVIVWIANSTQPNDPTERVEPNE